MFKYNETATEINMHAGDTGAFKVRATRSTGESWTEDDRLLFTIKNAGGEAVIQRFYRLDNDESLGNGVVEIQFHNNDTDQLEPGQYSMERRYVVNPYWDGTAPTGSCVNALTAGVRMIEGDVVRVAVQGVLNIQGILGEV